jgi:hypothetical protein
MQQMQQQMQQMQQQLQQLQMQMQMPPFAQQAGAGTIQWPDPAGGGFGGGFQLGGGGGSPFGNPLNFPAAGGGGGVSPGR